MTMQPNPFHGDIGREPTQDGVFSAAEVGLANRNSGMLLEALSLDVTPTGLHYLLNHFDVPILSQADHRLVFDGMFEAPFSMSMPEICALPRVTERVTLECAGNGRSGVSPRAFSMPWGEGAVGTSEWTGTPLAPLIAQASPLRDVVEIAFEGVDFGYDRGCGHVFGRSLTLAELDALDVMLVYEMNGAPLLPQHGAPLRIIVPGWYGMASVKWLSRITALGTPYDGFQQVRTYRFRTDADDPGRPVTTIRVKSLMKPPGVPDWISRKRLVPRGPVELEGRAWSGGGIPVVRVEVAVNGVWQEADLDAQDHRYAWVRWSTTWQAEAGPHVLKCRATDATGAVQPLEPPWDLSGFANNAAQSVEVFVE